MKGISSLWLIPVALMLIGLTFGLAGYPLLDPDEGRNAEVAREMAESNNYVLPRLNELPYIDKPIVFFAAAAASMEILGPSVLAARIAPLFFTLLTIALVFWFGRRLFGPTGGLIAACATGTMPLTLAFARTVIFDSTLTFFMSASLVALYLGIDADDSAEGSNTSQRWIPTGFGCIALGVLTKGPIALIVPMLVAVPFAVWRKRGRRLLDPIGWLLLIAIVLPWVAAVSKQVPDYARYVVYTESVGRLFTSELQRTGPLWYFFPIVLSGALPWSLVAIFGWKSFRWKNVKADDHVAYFLLWIVLPLLFFSLSQSKRPQYVVPLMPPIGLLVAYLWHAKPNNLPGARASALALLPVAVILGAAAIIVERFLDVSHAIASAIPGTAVILSVTTLVAAAGLWFWSTRIVVAVSMLSLPAAAIAVGSPVLMKAIGEDRSAFRAAEMIKPLMVERTEIVSIDTYPLSLPFYLQRTFTLSTTDGSELTSNYLARNLDTFRGQMDTPVRTADWWLDALVNCTRPRIFIVAARAERTRAVLAERLPLIVEWKRTAAYGPCSTTALATRMTEAGP